MCLFSVKYIYTHFSITKEESISLKYYGTFLDQIKQASFQGDIK